MKDHYRIKEISQLYGIGPDSLRYYEEIGILTPRRGENGYRQYGIRDIYKLNVIKDLRQLGFSMQRIKEYLDNKNIDTTLSLLCEEDDVIREEIERLRAKQVTIRSRIEEIHSFKASRTGEIDLVTYPDRPSVQLKTDVQKDEEIDFAFNRLHKRFEHRVYTLKNYMIGASLDIRDLRQGIFGLFRSVFFILEEREAVCDFLIPGGTYLSLHYRGGYEQSGEWIRAILEHADRAGFTLTGEMLELYKIDIHETNDREEFLTELQVRVED
ncbi:MerR family transcriptional regulator [Synergistaceae bacterium OttesenSCG-928-I11]|nr:MerR family transcriptional regulator [Synergistaceae bacterium OttesenSCG-928-I11]